MSCWFVQVPCIDLGDDTNNWANVYRLERLKDDDVVSMFF